MEKEMVSTAQRLTDNMLHLNPDVFPLVYIVLIEPDLDNRVFSGDLSIDVEVTTTQSWIVFHKTNLEISNLRINPTSNALTTIEIESVIDVPLHELCVITTSDRIDPGTYSIQLTFKGIINTQPIGLYLIEDEDPNGEPRHVLTSNFASNYARHIFPCFDHPSFKAKFHIRFTKPEDQEVVVISNMPMDNKAEDYPSLGLSTIRFLPTPISAVNSLVIIMGKLMSLPPSLTDGNIPLHVYTFPEMTEESGYMHTLGVAYIQFIQKYFKMDYFAQKIDIVVLPGSHVPQLASPGIIVLNDIQMVFTTDLCNTYGVLRLATTLAHFITTVWLGNIVTFEEALSVHVIKGCSTVVAHLAGHSILPHWHKEWVTLHLDYFPNLRRDSACLYPVAYEEDGCEVEENENIVNDRKCACLMRMVRDFSGLNFRKALGTLLFECWNNHCSIDILWKYLGSGLDLPEDFSKVMTDWLNNDSYPLISVIILHLNRYYMVQESFSDVPQGDKTHWDIPVKYITSESPGEVKFIWFEKEKNLVQLDVSPTARWMKLNWHCIGYYRVNYPLKVWKEIATDLASNYLVFDAEDRANLIDDAFSLAECARLFYDVPLGIVSYLKFGKEDHFLPFSIASLHLFCLYKKFSQTEMDYIYQRYIELLIEPYITVDLFMFDDSESFLRKKLKVEVIKMGCWVNHNDVLDGISALFQGWLREEEPPCEIKDIVFKYAFSKTTGEEWEDVFNLAKSETNAQKRKLLWSAVTSTKDQELITRVLNTLVEQDLPREEQFYIIKMVLNNPSVHNLVWEFIRDNWVELDNKFKENPHQLAVIVSDATRYFVLPSILEEVRDFFCDKPSTRMSDENKYSIMGNIKANINWHLAHYKLIREWLHYFITSQWPTS